MTITAENVRGGLVQDVGGVTYTLVLRNREIERFEDKHRGIFDLWEGLYRGGNMPTSKEVRDIVALAIVGGGKSDQEADQAISGLGPDSLQTLYAIAQNALGAAFYPDVGESAQKKSEAENSQSD